MGKIPCNITLILMINYKICQFNGKIYVKWWNKILNCFCLLTGMYLLGVIKYRECVYLIANGFSVESLFVIFKTNWRTSFIKKKKKALNKWNISKSLTGGAYFLFFHGRDRTGCYLLYCSFTSSRFHSFSVVVGWIFVIKVQFFLWFIEF